MSKKVIDFVVILDDGVRKRHYHESAKGHVTYFAIQLEVFVNGKWRTVIRYDSAHGFSHVDKYDYNGKQIKQTLDLSFESTLTFGSWDINENWRKYVKNFLN